MRGFSTYTIFHTPKPYSPLPGRMVPATMLSAGSDYARYSTSWSNRSPELVTEERERAIAFSKFSARSTCDPHVFSLGYSRSWATRRRGLSFIPWESGQAWMELPHCKLAIMGAFRNLEYTESVCSSPKHKTHRLCVLRFQKPETQRHTLHETLLKWIFHF